ncbi:Hypothetical predicted protein [Mytilus galloprovincialis]|uniref:Uncharacterized protein n=1 Tax=Mytilus galloprovincialis TaxID=29158 RepID=A0A8B6FUT1_MYTGA|nr:Hypothetical predicted protein [Mytilus galloprovincialis]
MPKDTKETMKAIPNTVEEAEVKDDNSSRTKSSLWGGIPAEKVEVYRAADDNTLRGERGWKAWLHSRNMLQMISYTVSMENAKRQWEELQRQEIQQKDSKGKQQNFLLVMASPIRSELEAECGWV